MNEGIKTQILSKIRSEPNPISLPDLLGKLDNQLPERTVRRWLVELVREGEIAREGKKRSTKYKAISKQENINLNFSKESLSVIEKIKQPLYVRDPKIYNEEWFENYIPNQSFYFSKKIRQQLNDAGRRSSGMEPAGTFAQQIFTRLLIDLSYNSSRLEGNTYSLLDTERLILQGASAEGKLDEEKIMILNHKEAIRYLVDTVSQTKLNEQCIHTIHFLLSDGLVDARYAGRVRDHIVKITGSAYIPHEGEHKLESQLHKIINKAKEINDAYEQSIFLLIHISYLQAFTDVNKRTARLSANIPLVINNLVPLSFNDVDKDDYISALFAIYELQDVRPLVELYVFSYLRTCVDYDSTIKKITYDVTRVRYRKQRRELLRKIIQGNLIGKPLDAFIKSQAEEIANINERADFINDVYEDLNLMDESRVAGLGISIDEVNEWIVKYHQK